MPWYPGPGDRRRCRAARDGFPAGSGTSSSSRDLGIDGDGALEQPGDEAAQRYQFQLVYADQLRRSPGGPVDVSGGLGVEIEGNNSVYSPDRDHVVLRGHVEHGGLDGNRRAHLHARRITGQIDGVVGVVVPAILVMVGRTLLDEEVHGGGWHHISWKIF